jgi:glycosyltransferase involved in cell wall biosynthesis
VSSAAPLAVAVDARPLLRTSTGVETYLRELLQELQTEPQLELQLLVDRPWALPRELAGCRRVLVPPATRAPRWLGDVWVARDVAQHLRRTPADVFFTASTKFPLGPVPSVVTVHDLGWRRMPQAYTRSERLRQRLWAQFAARRAARLVAVSQFTREDLVAFAPACAPRVRVVQEAAATHWQRLAAPHAAELVRRRARLSGPFVLAVGTLSPKKNLLALFAAFARLASAGFPQYSLAVAGKPGWKTEAILAAAHATPRVRLLGYVDDELLHALYSSAAAYVSASPCEGFGLPVLEAMACGTPVVVADCGALPEVTGDAALCCAPTEAGLSAALLRLLREPALARELTARGLLRRASFSWRGAARELAAVLREAAA